MKCFCKNENAPCSFLSLATFMWHRQKPLPSKKLLPGVIELRSNDREIYLVLGILSRVLRRAIVHEVDQMGQKPLTLALCSIMCSLWTSSFTTFSWKHNSQVLPRPSSESALTGIPEGLCTCWKWGDCPRWLTYGRSLLSSLLMRDVTKYNIISYRIISYHMM